MQKPPHALDLREIRTAKTGHELDAVVARLIEKNSLSGLAVSEIAKRIDDGYKPPNYISTYLISHRLIPYLYDSIKPSIRFFGTDNIIELYCSQFPDRAIEELLLSILYEVSQRADRPERRSIVEAITIFGSTETITTLKNIEEELRDTAAAAKLFGDSLLFPDDVVATAQLSFYELVRKAIDVVTARGSAPAPLYSTPAPLADDPVETPTDLQNLEREPQKVPIELLLKEGEGEQIEFKQTLRWDVQQDALHKPLEDQCLKAIAAFANSKGGTLLIGVCDDGRVPGLDSDLATVAGSRDKFDLHLTNLIKSRFSASFRAGCVSVSYPTVHEKLVCRVDVKPSRTPVYLAIKDVQGQASDRLIVRLGASSQEIPLSQVVAYVREHFDS
jgi:hypothetical protein